jgi:hypothetical protein
VGSLLGPAVVVGSLLGPAVVVGSLLGPAVVQGSSEELLAKWEKNMIVYLIDKGKVINKSKEEDMASIWEIGSLY